MYQEWSCLMFVARRNYILAQRTVCIPALPRDSKLDHAIRCPQSLSCLSWDAVQLLRARCAKRTWLCRACAQGSNAKSRWTIPLAVTLSGKMVSVGRPPGLFVRCATEVRRPGWCHPREMLWRERREVSVSRTENFADANGSRGSLLKCNFLKKKIVGRYNTIYNKFTKVLREAGDHEVRSVRKHHVIIHRDYWSWRLWGKAFYTSLHLISAFKQPN